MPPQRLERIVDRINGLHPDVIIAAGDYIGDNWFGREYPIGEAIAPLRRLKSRLGVYAVLGNNDYDVPAETVATDLRAAGITVLVNGAVSAGPLAIGGIDGAILPKHASWWARRNWTYSALRRTPGIKVLVAHRPDEFQAAPAWVSIVLAGHTHCGQIVLPLIGALETGSDYGSRYRCGVYRDGAKTLVVTGGLGTSHVPLRIGAPPDIWLITIRRSPAPAR
jgi:predicted MPP superfamily phosphohydrolase